MTNASLASRLNAKAVDPEEFQALLLEFYSNARYIEKGKIGYGGDGKNPSLVVSFSKKGEISDVLKGPAFVEDEIVILAELVQSQLIDEQRTAVGHSVMFSRQSLGGYFRYKNHFQIFPVPPEAPCPSFGVGYHAFQLEVQYISSPAVLVEISREKKALNEIELLCGALLGPSIRAQSDFFQNHWVIDEFGEEPTYSYSQEGYGWPGMRGTRNDDFSGLDSLPAAPEEPAIKYYAVDAVLVRQPLSIPDTLTHSLGPVDKLDSQASQDVIQDSFCGGYLGTVADGGCRVGVL